MKLSKAIKNYLPAPNNKKGKAAKYYASSPLDITTRATSHIIKCSTRPEGEGQLSTDGTIKISRSVPNLASLAEAEAEDTFDEFVQFLSIESSREVPKDGATASSSIENEVESGLKLAPTPVVAKGQHQDSSGDNDKLKLPSIGSTIHAVGGTCPFTSGGAAVATTEVKPPQDTPPMPSGKCPFKHGTVYAGPYPGYVHGNPNRSICPNGCRPELNCGITRHESPKETLLREATEFLELYYHERRDDMKGSPGFLSKDDRMETVRLSIERTGTYEHTFDELEHGARLAWRNAPKCSNRKFWASLKLLDARDVTTNQGMYDKCIHHLTKAMASGSSEAYVTVFKPKTAEDKDGPRIWNDQLLSYASYKIGGEDVGDPKNLRFTQMLEERFGWTGPADGKQGSHDYLPLVMQVDPDSPPELFEVPLEVAPHVQIHHPSYPKLAELNMKWYPIPAVCALDMELGGITYTAVPFNGWYASTEVVRDLTDESRYNLLTPVAEALGFDTDTKPGEAPLWIDMVMAILSMAVYHSFQKSKIAMVDHHNLINMFFDWYNDEMKHRGFCPTNWKWVIPPMSSSTSPAYLGLNKAQEYTLKPAYVIGKGFLELETRQFGPRDRTKAVDSFIEAIYLAMFFKRMISRFRARKQPVLIVYASVTGNAAKYASELGCILRPGANVSFVDACGPNPDDPQAMSSIQDSSLTIFVTSTQGNGELPSLSQKFFANLFGKQGHLLTGKDCCVLGFGSTAYPIFCGAAVYLSDKLSELGAKEIVPRGQCDSVKGEANDFHKWSVGLVKTSASLPSASSFMEKLAENIKESTASNLAQQSKMVDYVKVQVYTKKEVESAAGKAFMMKTLDENCCTQDDNSREQILMDIIAKGGNSIRPEKDILEAQVISREDLVDSGRGRKTSLLKLSLEAAGSPPYNPGDHVRVFPRNVVAEERLQTFVSHLQGTPSLDDQVHVSVLDGTPTSELAVSLPLVHGVLSQIIPLGHILKRKMAVLAPISAGACLLLAQLASASGKDKALLTSLGQEHDEYEKMSKLSGMKWIDLFKTFPSLSGQVTIRFLLCNIAANHPRSYSISSCKDIVGNELHLSVGRFLYSRGGSKMEAGICSDFLTSVMPGDDVQFKVESCPSFHYPLESSSPIVFICTGTGFAPIRGLLQKRSYFKARGERLGAAFLVFGSRNSEEGLFHDEIKELQKKGVLTKVFLCYSREQGRKKEYTTDVLKRDRLKALLAPVLAKPNSHVFMCGSANMAQKSKEALMNISHASVEKIIEEGRLHTDVFGAFSPRKGPRRRSSSYDLADSLHSSTREPFPSIDTLEVLNDDSLHSSTREQFPSTDTLKALDDISLHSRANILKGM